MKTCANCGAVAEATASQCERCGMQLPDAAGAPAAAPAGSTPAPTGAPLGAAADSGARVLRGIELAISLALIVAGGAMVAIGTFTTVGWVLIAVGALGVLGFGIC